LDGVNMTQLCTSHANGPLQYPESKLRFVFVYIASSGSTFISKVILLLFPSHLLRHWNGTESCVMPNSPAKS
jgi:hypothetical protein